MEIYANDYFWNNEAETEKQTQKNQHKLFISVKSLVVYMFLWKTRSGTKHDLQDRLCNIVKELVD